MSNRLVLVNQPVTNQPWAMLLWRGLRSPKLTIGALVVLSVTVVWGFFIPQQLDHAPHLNTVLWRSNLPQLLQPWGDFLFSIGLAHIFQTLWFWFPVGTLFINSLIALADYTPKAWQRWQSSSPSIEWQHPLATRSIKTMPIRKNINWDTLKKPLNEQGFITHQNDKEDRLSATKYGWAWLIVSVIYMGLIMLPVALLGSYYYLEIDQFVLSPADKQQNALLAGQLELQMDEQDTIVYTPNQTKVEKSLSGSLYQPQFLSRVLVMVTSFDPVLTVHVSNSSDKLVRLLPFQENLDPSERLHLPLGDNHQSLYFRIVSEGLTFQITPSGEGEYNIQVLREQEITPFVNETIYEKTPLSVDQLSVHIATNHQAEILAYYDPFTILYLLSATLIFSGGIGLLLRSPVLLWFVAEQQDSYQWLHGATERFGKTKNGQHLLHELLHFFPPNHDELT
ncbi:cytochrome c biogenesis protein ResB [Anaerolineales bacterium HSG25]|nr:cytochrome c biogenesis protein ResB [Anaerolineales bacterium HSG25]